MGIDTMHYVIRGFSENYEKAPDTEIPNKYRYPAEGEVGILLDRMGGNYFMLGEVLAVSMEHRGFHDVHELPKRGMDLETEDSIHQMADDIGVTIDMDKFGTYVFTHFY